jgi:hypothetical protein
MARAVGWKIRSRDFCSLCSRRLSVIPTQRFRLNPLEHALIRNSRDVIHCGTPTVGISEKHENRSSPATGQDYKTSMYVINPLETEAR